MEPAGGALPSLAKDSKGPKGTKGPKDPCDDPSEVRHGDAMGLVPNLDQAKFIALGAQLVIIRDLCHQDLRFKVSEPNYPPVIDQEDNRGPWFGMIRKKR